jgi:two-component system response regulator GlrR
VEQFEREYISTLLLCHEGNISRASKAAGKNRRAFWELIRKYGIDVQGFRHHHL